MLKEFISFQIKQLIKKMDNKKKYGFWFKKDSIKQFESKKSSDFFKTEELLHNLIKGKVNSILDVGCASGRLIELLNIFHKNFSYFGIDVVPKQIEYAKKNYKTYEFECIDIFRLKLKKKFELVNATGIFQHEENFIELLEKMWSYSNKYVLFDVKFSMIKNHLVDKKKSFCEINNTFVPYIFFTPNLFINELRKLKKIKKISCLCYETPINKFTTIPSYIKNIFSCGFLIEKGSKTIKNFDVNILEYKKNKLNSILHKILKNEN